MTDIILKEALPEEPSTLGRVGRYVLLRRLAAGGMGEVFLAKLAGPVGFQKLVVLKRMLAQVEADSDYNRMFLAEAQITAQLNHSNIAQTYELGETDDGGYYIVMEYIRGKSLLDLLKRAYHAKEPIPYRLAVGIIAESCAGLGYAHGARGHDGAELNIVHRDVSPSNLLVSYAGEVKVIDFGIAIADSVERGTVGGQIKGKLSYMSPEQCRGDALDQRSDVFSLGVCLYEALTLRNPFKRDTLPSTMRAILEDPIPPALDDSHPLAPVLGPVLKRVLEKDREARISSCAELRETLLGILPDLPEHDESLTVYMNRAFGEEEAKTRALVAELMSGPIDASPSGWTSLNLGAQPTLTHVSVESPTMIPEDPPASSRGMMVAIGALALVAIVLLSVLGGVLLSRDDKPAVASVQPIEPAPPPEPAVADPPPPKPPEPATVSPPEDPKAVAVAEPEPAPVDEAVAVSQTPEPPNDEPAVDPSRSDKKTVKKAPRASSAGRHAVTVITSPPVPVLLGGEPLRQDTVLTRRRSSIKIGKGVRLVLYSDSRGLRLRAESDALTMVRMNKRTLGNTPTSIVPVSGERVTLQFSNGASSQVVQLKVRKL